MKLVYLASITVLIPFLTGIFSYRKLSRPGRQLTWLFGFWLIAEIAGIVIAYAGYKNLIIYLLVSCVEMLMIANFFSMIYSSSRAKDSVLVLGIVGVLICLADYIRTGEALGFFAMAYETIFIFSMGLYALYMIITGAAAAKFQFMILIIMLLFTGSAIYFLAFQTMIYEEGIFRLFGLLHKMFLICCYILFSIGMWRLRMAEVSPARTAE